MSQNVLLVSIAASYAHSSLALRLLKANLGELQSNAIILEYTIKQKSLDIVEQILSCQPKIVAFGVYVWNLLQTTEIISILKKVRPELYIIIGGPEVSYGNNGNHDKASNLLLDIYEYSDFVIEGEGEVIFSDLCHSIISDNLTTIKGQSQSQSQSKFLKCSQLANLSKIASPYFLYTDEDLKQRYIYVEASRGCPFNCEYCISSLDKQVRFFPLDSFLQDMEMLISRGGQHFKFIDRTFNLNTNIACKILEFFLKHISKGVFLHFEMIPDRLPNELKQLLKLFPPASIQLEIGIQSWNPEVIARIARQQNVKKIEKNFSFLREETNVHVHADLIAGLPGESLESFAKGFDSVYALGPHEIQLGLLKYLKGTKLLKHSQEWLMVFSDLPPYQILSNKHLDFVTVQQLSRMSQFWNLIANKCNFPNIMMKLKKLSSFQKHQSLFWIFWELSNFLYMRYGRTHSISLLNLAEGIWMFFTDYLDMEKTEIALLIFEDYSCGITKRDPPYFLKSYLEHRKTIKMNITDNANDNANKDVNSSEFLKTCSLQKRQQLHSLKFHSGNTSKPTRSTP